MMPLLFYFREKREVLAHEIEREAEECSRLKDEIASRNEQLYVKSDEFVIMS